jgi:RNA polymerase sigma-70 factor, ECF subfamily
MSRTTLDVFADPTDEDLLLSWRHGSPQAGQILFDRHYETVRRYFRNKVPATAIRDLVQETFLACVEGYARIRYHSTFRAYLLGIAHHVLVDHFRAAARHEGRAVDLAEMTLGDLPPAGDDAIAAKRERRLLLRALRRLRFPLQVVLELRYWESMSDQEIAEVLAEPLGTVKTRLRTGRHALEEQLAQLASTPDELRSTLDSLRHWASRVRRGALAQAAPDPDDTQPAVRPERR